VDSFLRCRDVLTCDFLHNEARGRPGLGLTESPPAVAIHLAPEMLQLTKRRPPDALKLTGWMTNRILTFL
jgi:hypothetical protein